MAAAPRRRRALIIGGSLGGLFAAAALMRAGVDVVVCERNAAPLAGRGAGISTHDALLAALRQLGIPADSDLGIAVKGRRTYGRDGGTIASLAFAQVNTSWYRLFQLLRARVADDRYRLGKVLVGVTETARDVTARFQDGETIEADLLVAADGIRSRVRAQMLPEVEPQYAGYVAWRGMVEEGHLSAAAHDDLMPYFSFCLPPSEQMLGYAVAGAGNALEPGRRRFNFVWYRPADDLVALPRLLTDAAGRVHAQSIPPPLISQTVIADMRRAAEDLLSPAYAEVVRLSPSPFLQPIYDLAVPHMAFGRVALIGDAAFVVRPHVGAGVTKAALDALALAEAVGIGDDIPSALRRFDAARVPAGHRFVARGRDLGACLQATIRTPAEAAAAAMYRVPETMMRETASLAFIGPDATQQQD